MVDDLISLDQCSINVCIIINLKMENICNSLQFYLIKEKKNNSPSLAIPSTRVKVQPCYCDIKEALHSKRSYFENTKIISIIGFDCNCDDSNSECLNN